MRNKLANMLLGGALALGSGCVNTTRTVDDGGMRKRVVPLADSGRIVIENLDRPQPGSPELGVLVLRSFETRQEHYTIERVLQISQLHPVGKALVTPLALPFAILSFGEVNLWGEVVNELSRRETIERIDIQTLLKPAIGISVGLQTKDTPEVYQEKQFTNTDGMAIFSLAAVIRAAFEDVRTERLTLVLEVVGVRREVSIDRTDLQSLYLAL